MVKSNNAARTKGNTTNKKQKEESEKYLAIIRVRGKIGVRKDIEECLRRMKLTKPNHLVIYKDSPILRGMIKKVKDYITWGEVNKDIIKKLDNSATKEVDYLYRLQPPRKGWGRKGIKYNYSLGGALGYRGEKIIEVIERMLPNK